MELLNSAFSTLGASFSNFSNLFLTLLYPQECRICGHSVEHHTDGFICAECWHETHFFDGQEIVCHKCSRFLKSDFSDTKIFCHECETDAYDSARSVGFYERALAVSVLNLKRTPFLPLKLQNLIRIAYDDSPFHDTDLIIPAPLSARRQRERGFNQSALIAQIIAKHTNLPLDEFSLKRSVHTEKHRAGMDRKSRAESVAKAFEVTRPRLIQGKNILLIDDVFTSGATVSNCAEVLKKNGAEKVYVFTIARAY